MKNFVCLLFTFLFFPLTTNFSQAQIQTAKPLRLAVAGVVHGHAPFILGRKGKTDIELVGVYEKNNELALRYAKKYNFSTSLIYSNLIKMLDAVKPEAVVAFGTILDHMMVVEACAPRGIHVMVEKPLATTLIQAEKMLELAKKYNIFLLTDYETSWYPTTAKSYQLVNDSNYVGHIRKVVFHDGHQGPKELGCNKEFLEWLTDPILNGGGAMTDFGCYGANLMTYLMKGQLPVSVTAVTQHFKPEVYPKVEDEGTIIVTYPTAQCIIQASWNWPYSRKDIEIYGDLGYVFAINNTLMHLKNNKSNAENTFLATSKNTDVYEDPFEYFINVLNGKEKLKNYDLYSPENNKIVVKILDAAKKSSKTGKTIFF